MLELAPARRWRFSRVAQLAKAEAGAVAAPKAAAPAPAAAAPPKQSDGFACEDDVGEANPFQS